MKRMLHTAAILILLLMPATSLLAAEIDFNDFLHTVNLSAEADLPGFKARLSTEFPVPVPKIEGLLKALPTPADAYMCLRVSQLSAQPVEVVLSEYRRNPGKGWGAIAKQVGIKPGSREFHALKEGRFDAPAKGGGKGKEHGRKK